MDAIKLSVVIGQDRRLVVQLPDDTPLGPAEIVIKLSESAVGAANPAREAAKARLLAGGFLVTDIHAPEGTVPLTPEERMRMGRLPPGTRPSDELIIEDRGEY